MDPTKLLYSGQDFNTIGPMTNGLNMTDVNALVLTGQTMENYFTFILMA